MTARQLLDFRAGNPWTDVSRATFERASTMAWADPQHPGSEGRRSAVWRDAVRATVSACTGFPHVRFVADRRAAYDLLTSCGIGLEVAPATHRRHVLRRVHDILAVGEDGHIIAPVPETGWLGLQAANDETGVRDRLPRVHHVILDADVTLGRVPVRTDVPVVIADARAWGSPLDLAIVLSHDAFDVPDAVQVPHMAVAVDSLGRAFDGLEERMVREASAMQSLEDRLQRELPDIQFHGRDRVPHIRSFSVLHLDGETLMRALDEKGWGVGSGSACAHDGSPSDVLAAMGRVTHGNVRIALPIDTDVAVLDDFATDLIDIVERLRREAGVEGL